MDRARTRCIVDDLGVGGRGRETDDSLCFSLYRWHRVGLWLLRLDDRVAMEMNAPVIELVHSRAGRRSLPTTAVTRPTAVDGK
jgi:hypothetical protein